VNQIAAWRRRLADFLFSAQSDRWLTFLRFGLGFQVLLYALSLFNDWNYLFGTTESGLATRDLAEALLALANNFVPRLGWLVAIGAHLGLQEQAVLSGIWIVLFCAGLGLLVGLFCRSFAILAWFLHLCTAKSGAFVSYGVDDFMTIGLFYLMLSPLPDRYSLDYRLRKSRTRNARLLGFGRRVLQMHLCLIYLFSGLTKCLGGGWWDGSNIWRALTRPPFNVIPPEILVRWKLFLPIVGILVCLIEAGYPVFIWLKRTRFFWLSAVIAMHVAIGITMGMYLFALIMIVLNAAAFGPGIFGSISTQPVRSGRTIASPS
jgi:hypothetical protein